MGWALGKSETAFSTGVDHCVANHFMSAWITKGKACLNKVITLYKEMTGLADEGRSEHIVYIDFSQAIDKDSHKILR